MFQIKKLENGLTVACLDNGGKLTTIGVVSKAGCRYENYEEAGLTHAIRAAFGLSSSKFTGFGIMRNIQQAGACVEASGNRDFLIYSTQFVRGFKNEHVLDYMFDAVSNPQFRRWEIPAAHEKVKVQVAEMEPHVRATELLHKAAYRQGLGNSLYSPEHMVRNCQSKPCGKIFMADFQRSWLSKSQKILVTFLFYFIRYNIYELLLLFDIFYSGKKRHNITKNDISNFQGSLSSFWKKNVVNIIEMERIQLDFLFTT